jgi:hypothetical protein
MFMKMPQPCYMALVFFLDVPSKVYIASQFFSRFHIKNVFTCHFKIVEGCCVAYQLARLPAAWYR